MQNIEIIDRGVFAPVTQNSHSITTLIIPEMQFDCKIWTGKTEK